MWCAAAREAEWRFLQPEVRRRRPRRMCVCDACFATALAEEQRACICTAAGWFLGRREARAAIAFARIAVVERHWLLTSSVAAWSADDFTVRRGATRPVAPCKARAIAAHFMIAMLCRSYDDVPQRLTSRIRGADGRRSATDIALRGLSHLLLGRQTAP